MTTETRVVDYADARPKPATIKADGYVGALRYIAAGRSSKLLDRAEVNRLHATGISVGVVVESTANRAASGRANGIADAKAALAGANALGVPKTVPIFLAVDFEATAAQVSAYFAGAKTVLGSRTGIYGGYDVMGVSVAWRWQTAAWSGGRLSTRAHILQRAEAVGAMPAGCDQNVICKPIGFWAASGMVQLTPPGAKPTSKPAQLVTKVVHSANVQKALDALKAVRDNALKAGATKRAETAQENRNHLAVKFPGVKKKVKK